MINGSRAFELEVSKVKQDVALRRHGIRTPKTLGVVGRQNLVSASRKLDAPFITKHNQGGKGLGIEFVEDADGNRYVYDINTTTNYNAAVEAQHELSGMRAQARLVRRELDRLVARAA